MQRWPHGQFERCHRSGSYMRRRQRAAARYIGFRCGRPTTKGFVRTNAVEMAAAEADNLLFSQTRRHLPTGRSAGCGEIGGEHCRLWPAANTLKMRRNAFVPVQSTKTDMGQRVAVRLIMPTSIQQPAACERQTLDVGSTQSYHMDRGELR